MNITRNLIIVGSVILGFGLFLYAYDNLPLIGKLKGDILISSGRFKFYFPLMTSLIISLLMTLLLNIFR